MPDNQVSGQDRFFKCDKRVGWGKKSGNRKPILVYLKHKSR